MNNFSQEFFSKDYFFGKKKSNYHKYSQWDNNRYWKSIVEVVKKYKISGNALDVGCAFGFLLKRLNPYFDEIHGIDISDFALVQAKKEIPTAKLKKVDINNQDIPYPDGHFELITALDVLEHTKSIEQSLRKIKAKLKDNGYLVISVPLKDTWAGKIFHIFDKDSSHVSVPTKKELFEVIEKNDLKILEKNYFLNMIFFKFKSISVNIEIVLQKNH
ncbi:MAG: class I SAM-dependent methyltransferase [bacterium]